MLYSFIYSFVPLNIVPVQYETIHEGFIGRISQKHSFKVFEVDTVTVCQFHPRRADEWH
jgi:hypothetical protein